MSISAALKSLLVAILAIVAIILVMIVGNEVMDYTIRVRLFSELQPVQLRNCELKRYGLGRDEGYLLCDNFLKNTEVVYSYGIDGRDGLGCEISTELNIPLHQYDCFNLTRPLCDKRDAVFHEECVSGVVRKDLNGRLFDTVENQIAKNNDSGKTILLKIDVEGAEWDSLATVSEKTFKNVDQIVAEFHKERDHLQYLDLIRKLKQTYHIAHIHFNNHACTKGLDVPFPSRAFQVLLVNKNLGVLDGGKKPVLPNPLDEKDGPYVPDCQNLDQESRYQILEMFAKKIGRRFLRVPSKLVELTISWRR